MVLKGCKVPAQIRSGNLLPFWAKGRSKFPRTEMVNQLPRKASVCLGSRC